LASGTIVQLDNGIRHVVPSGRASIALVFVLCGIAALAVGLQKGDAVAQQMGTHYAQEQVRELREKAAKAASTSVAKRLRLLADRLDRMAPEFYFQPLESAPEMERLSH
jgi:uncharacterized membrane protein YidH (DUF202 family)